MEMDSVAVSPLVDRGPVGPVTGGAAPTPGCRYHTVQPAPTQWVAIGVAQTRGDDGAPTPRLLVEVGRSEEEAVAALRGRCGCA